MGPFRRRHENKQISIVIALSYSKAKSLKYNETSTMLRCNFFPFLPTHNGGELRSTLKSPLVVCSWHYPTLKARYESSRSYFPLQKCLRKALGQISRKFHQIIPLSNIVTGELNRILLGKMYFSQFAWTTPVVLSLL